MIKRVIELIENEFCYARNYKLHSANLSQRLEKSIMWKVFDSCDSVVKQVHAGIPQEKIEKDFIKFLKGNYD